MKYFLIGKEISVPENDIEKTLTPDFFMGCLPMPQAAGTVTLYKKYTDARSNVLNTQTRAQCPIFTVKIPIAKIDKVFEMDASKIAIVSASLVHFDHKIGITYYPKDALPKFPCSAIPAFEEEALSSDDNTPSSEKEDALETDEKLISINGIDSSDDEDSMSENDKSLDSEDDFASDERESSDDEYLINEASSGDNSPKTQPSFFTHALKHGPALTLKLIRGSINSIPYVISGSVGAGLCLWLTGGPQGLSQIIAGSSSEAFAYSLLLTAVAMGATKLALSTAKAKDRQKQWIIKGLSFATNKVIGLTIKSMDLLSRKSPNPAEVHEAKPDVDSMKIKYFDPEDEKNQKEFEEIHANSPITVDADTSRKQMIELLYRSVINAAMKEETPEPRDALKDVTPLILSTSSDGFSTPDVPNIPKDNKDKTRLRL